MFKKINQTLITKYPLIWNLKFIWILLAVIIFNIVAFINGFLFFNKKSQLQESGLYDVFYNSGLIFFYILIGVLIAVIWLYFYIKNNRFKSNYPTSRNYLFKEFLAVFFIFFLMFYVPNSFKAGLKFRVSNYMSEEQYLKDIDIINRAQGFTLQPSFGYDNYSRNLPVPVFDSLVSEKDIKDLYEKNEKEYLKENPTLSYNPILEPYFRNPEFETLLANHFPDRKSYNKIIFNETYSPLIKKETDNFYERAYPTDVAVEAMATYEVDSVSYSTSTSEKPEIYYNLASLYNYSFMAFNNPKDSTKNHQYYDEQWIALLQKNDRKAIENLLNKYTDLLKNQEIGYQFKHKNWIDYLPQSPYYFIDNKLDYVNTYQTNNDNLKDYINQDSLNKVYENIEFAKYQSTWLENIKYYLLVTLIFTVLVITFRFSSFKVWLISLIGAGILAILGSVFGISIDASIGYKQFTPYIILLLFYITFITITIFGLRNKKYKILTGINLNWFVATNIFIGITMLSFYTDIRTEMLYKPNMGINIYDLRETNKELQMLQSFSEIFLYINPILFVVSFYFIINLYKKWQAMPEE